MKMYITKMYLHPILLHSVVPTLPSLLTIVRVGISLIQHFIPTIQRLEIYRHNPIIVLVSEGIVFLLTANIKRSIIKFLHIFLSVLLN